MSGYSRSESSERPQTDTALAEEPYRSQDRAEPEYPAKPTANTALVPTRVGIRRGGAKPVFSSSRGVCGHAPQPRLELWKEAPDTRQRTGTVAAKTCACRWHQPENAPAHRQSTQQHARPRAQIAKRPARCAQNTMRTQLQTPGSLLHGIRLAYFPCVSRDEIRRWTSSHGTVLAFPESNSAMRRLISSFQALSAPSSTAASRLSIREQAKSARSSSERERAFCSRSRTCCVIRRL